MKSIKELAAELNVNERTVRRHISKLNIRTQKQGTKQLIDADAQEMLKKAIADNRTIKTDNRTILRTVFTA